MDSTSLVAAFGIFSSIIAAVFASQSWTQKTLVQVLKDQIAAGEKRELALVTDNKEQAQTINKMGASIDKLTEQGAQTIRLLEDVVYGRQQAQRERRS